MTEIVRWGAFSSALVLVVLLVCGSSPLVAFGTSIGLVGITAACRALLRQSERTYTRLAAEQAGPHRGRHGRTGAGAHRGGRQPTHI
ncbi:hypothetical protein ACWGJ2_10545 [Streptomyces sp. NPDC054796]|uniref:Uncharacterized protein n=1 Tax=Streptomyces daliensis TaxID=299421 RepID=A0A8T4J556_9ACTN|nr:hypothetical protein [Streptomyces daliensis]